MVPVYNADYISLSKFTKKYYYIYCSNELKPNKLKFKPNRT